MAAYDRFTRGAEDAYVARLRDAATHDWDPVPGVRLLAFGKELSLAG